MSLHTYLHTLVSIAFTIPEDIAATPFGSVRATDRDMLSSILYSLTDSVFMVDPANGNLTKQAGVELDFETRLVESMR